MSSIHTLQFWHESKVYLSPKIWDLIRENTKTSESLSIFKTKIKDLLSEISMLTMQGIRQSDLYSKSIPS